MALMPMAMYGLEVPTGDVAISARPDIPSAFRITMAAIDPSAEPEGEEGVAPRATLKVIRQSLLDDEDDDDDSDFDQDRMEALLAEEYSDDSEDDDDDEEVNGGPSDPSKSKKARIEAARRDMKKMLEAENGMEVDDDSDDDDSDAAIPNGVNGTKKSAKALGKRPASDSDEDEDSDMDDVNVEEYVICTLDPNKLYQQPLDITFGEDEKVWFKVSGTHSIFLTGNYVEPVNGAQDMFDPDSDDEEDLDMEPDMDELDDSEDESIDELDDLEDPRVTELDDDEEVPQLITKGKESKAKDIKDQVTTNKSKNKRPASDSEDEDDDEGGAETLDAMIAKEEVKVAKPTTNGEQKLSKKQLKKLKKNDGAAAAAPIVEKVAEKKDAEVPQSSSSNKSEKSDKKVSFAKELEQGPTPTKAAEPKADSKAESKDKESKDKPKSALSLGVKTVQGVTLDDKKLGSGQAAKNGDRVSMRYIGKLKDNNKVFDSNKKGKPFNFKLGAGEVIKGWEIGVQGMQAGGERRITIPAHLAYGSKKVADIPPNSALIFDVKVLDINKKG